MSREYFESYPYLHALVGGWFHQDFDIDGSTLDDVLASYRGRSHADDRLGVKADIQRFLRNTPPEQVEAEFQTQFSATGFPGRDQASLHDWLQRVYALL